MPNPTSNISRRLVGAIALVLLAAAIVLTLLPGGVGDGAGLTWRGGCARVGIVMAALWLALPSGERPAAWSRLNPRTIAVVMLIVVALLRIPFRLLAPLAGILLVAGVLLRPRDRKRPNRSR